MTGWVWPLDGIQHWLESLWDWIAEAASLAIGVVSTWVWDAVEWVFDSIASVVRVVQGAIKGFIDGLGALLTGAIDVLAIGIGGFFDVLWTFLSEGWTWLSTTVSQGLGDLWTGITEGFAVVTNIVGEILGNVWTAISDGFSTLGTMISAGIGGLFDSLMGVAGDILAGAADVLGGILEFIWTGLADAAGTIATVIMGGMEALSKTLHIFVEGPIIGMLDAASDAMGPGSPPKEIKTATERWTKALEEAVKRPIPKKGKSPPSLAVLSAASAGLIAGMSGVYALTHAISGALDATHPLKKWGFKAAIMDILHTISIDAALGPMVDAPIWAGVIIPMRMRYRQLFPYEVPGTSELARMRTQRIIPDALYKENMSFHAFDATWSDYMERSVERVPSFGDMSRMVWLGLISMDDLLDAQRHMGIREEFIAGYEELTKILPGRGDLITMMVREVIDPTIFIETMAMQGVDEIWSNRHYEAHWILLPLGKVEDARYRGLINDAELATYLKLHDYKPDPRPEITLSDQELAGKLIWKIPGRIEARWMYKWGDIDQAGLEALLIKDGMDPEWAPIVAAATARNQMLAEINRLRDNSKKDYTKGLITEEQMRVNLEALRYSAELIEFHVADALSDGERDLKLEAIDLIMDGYVKDIITYEELESGLAYYIVRPEVLQAELDRAYVTKFRKPKAS